ncbi:MULTISPECIES: hypothetical protein [unclassified Paraburkholderia]|uniref:hypothetical protein n=1 Tax=unclassified Paraburkholderia TaxID=2615204 RepID=UPI002AB1AB4A|nr:MULTISPECIES: hypothetical protein [unclassified Paraburkholderia]
MKNRLLAALIVSTTMLPAFAFAQDQHISRAFVQPQVVQAEQSGTQHVSHEHDPNGATTTSATSSAKAGNSGYGTATAESSQSGSTAHASALKVLYRHH